MHMRTLVVITARHQTRLFNKNLPIYIHTLFMFEFFFHVSFTHFLKIICFQEKITQLYVKKKPHF